MRFQLRFDLPAQRCQRFELIRRQRAGAAVDHAERPEGVAVRGDQRGAGVEPDVRVSRHLRVVSKAVVVQRVGDDEDVPLLDCVCAKRYGTGGLGDRHADSRLEPLTVLIDERDERHRRAADVGGEQREIVEAAFGLGIEDAILAQRREPCLLVARHVRLSVRPQSSRPPRLRNRTPRIPSAGRRSRSRDGCGTKGGGA
jgi:hypothetical protein